MTITTERPAPAATSAGSGSSTALRRWSWRLFRREWRQQVLVLLLLIVAVGATVAGTAIAANATPIPNTQFIVNGTDPDLSAHVQTIRSQTGGTVVYETSITIPGSLLQVSVRAENPDGAIGLAAVHLLSGKLPTAAGQVAMTSKVAAELGLSIGQSWSEGGVSRVLVGLVRNPNNYADQFALVIPGQVPAPQQVIISAPPRDQNLRFPGIDLGINSTSSASKAAAALLVLTLSTLMLTFVGLIASAGFSVMAQRRLRALGMLASVGATDRQVRNVMLANGLIVGSAAGLVGGVVGLIGWLIYAPHLAYAASHDVSRWNLEWWAVILAVGLSVLTSLAAAWWPARRVARISVVAALSGRPPVAPPTRRPAALGVAFLIVGLGLMTVGHRQAVLVVVSILFATVGLLLLTPLAIRLAARLAGRSPLEVRLAVRDLARFESRSAGALRAITLAVVIAATISIVAGRQERLAPQQHYNLAANEMVVYLSSNGVGAPVSIVSGSSISDATNAVSSIAHQLGAKADLELDQAVDLANETPQGYQGASLDQVDTSGNQFSDMYVQGLYVATPELLRYYGISGVNPDTQILSSRRDLTGLTLTAGGMIKGDSSNKLVNNPVVQHEPGLPANSSEPNTLLTESEMTKLGLTIEPAGWLLRTSTPLTDAQISNARKAAAAAGLTIETRNGSSTLASIGNDFTAGGVILALGVLAMTIGLIRSETANDLRTLAATGASPRTRRKLTACTAGALAFLGALCGVVGAYASMVAWFHSSLSSLDHVPFADLAVLLIGFPIVAAVGGWVFAGREPAGLGRRPLE
ncbi:MAG TPA: FtsX-like permease family protein [Acidimicrobiales bacterium]|nr:FtsX-like permease family protein [Acidimicrobiales bacterium]